MNQYLEQKIIQWSQQDKGVAKTNAGGWHSTTDMNKKEEYNQLTKELFNMEERDSKLIAIEDCQSNKVFTAEYLEEVRIAQEQSGCRESLEKQLTRDFNGLRKPYGRLLKIDNVYLNAIDVRQIFDTGTCLIHNETGKHDFPNGLQIRDGVIVDDENVD